MLRKRESRNILMASNFFSTANASREQIIEEDEEEEEEAGSAKGQTARQRVQCKQTQAEPKATREQLVKSNKSQEKSGL